MANRYNKKDLVGKKINMMTVIEEIPERKNNHIMFKCVCDCGNEKIVRGASLTAGNTQSCGCVSVKVHIKVGNRYGKLVVLESVDVNKKFRKEFLCICDCGGIISVPPNNLVTGNTKSCGCIIRNDNMTTEERIKGRAFSLQTSHCDITYDAWRKRVFEKDGYVCQCCGNFGIDLDAHHLDGWDWCEEERLNVYNGISLCRHDCHKDFHKRYGRGGNTKAQYYEFYELRKYENKFENLF